GRLLLLDGGTEALTGKGAGEGWIRCLRKPDDRSGIRFVVEEKPGCPVQLSAAAKRACGGGRSILLPVAGLVPAIHVFARDSDRRKEGVDGRKKSGHGVSRGRVPHA